MLSGLRVNFHKSTISGVGVEAELVDVFANALRCKNQSLPLKFLGFPLGASLRRCSTWKPVVDNFRSKLAGWKSKFLSFGGRVTLLKSVLTSLPIYFMSLFKMPDKIALVLDKIQARFL